MRFLRPGRLITYALLAMYIFSSSDITMPQIEVVKGDSYSSLISKHFSGLEKYQLKRWLRGQGESLSKLQPGFYQFTGSVTREAFFEKLGQGPGSEYQRVTLLEGRSIYDIDDYLTKKKFIKEGQYLDYVMSGAIIRENTLNDEFLWWTSRGELKSLLSLEGFLYPETYNVDSKKPIIPQLVQLQLKQFETIVRKPLASEIRQYNSTLSTLWFVGVSLNRYQQLILATVIEKEERVDKNRAIIAGIFLNRLASKMRLDADITLCYGLKQGYENCPPSVIVMNLDDSNNLYNTRRVIGLPPTPIANPSIASIRAVLQPTTSKSLFYLHDNKGRIYTATTNAEHELNKSKHLQ
jgi:UPF0755 protein